MHPTEGDPTQHRTPPPRLRPQESALTPGDSARYDVRFASRASGIVSSVMRDLMSLAERPDIISLAGGFPNTESFQREMFDEVIEVVARDHLASTLQYGPTEGLLELRERIAEVMAHYGATAGVDDIMVTSGGQQAIDLSIRTFVDPGDTILAEGPTYPGAVPCFTTYEARVEHVPMDDDGLRVDLVEDRLAALEAEGRRPKLLYTIPNFQNPSGATLSLERRRRLLEICDAHDILVLEDDPYGRLRFEGDNIPGLWTMASPGRVVFTSSFSKTVAPGLRVGYLVSPPAIAAKLAAAASRTYISPALLSEASIHQLIVRGGLEPNIEKVTALMRERRDAMTAGMRHMPEGTEFTTPQGGFFYWMTLPAGLSADDLFEPAGAAGIAYVKGSDCVLDGGERTLRLAYSGVGPAEIEEGMERLGAVFAASPVTSA